MLCNYFTRGSENNTDKLEVGQLGSEVKYRIQLGILTDFLIGSAKFLCPQVQCSPRMISVSWPSCLSPFSPNHSLLILLMPSSSSIASCYTSPRHCLLGPESLNLTDIPANSQTNHQLPLIIQDMASCIT